jgi:hypothetical protein
MPGPSRSGNEFPSQVHGDRLVLSGREADVGDRDAPPAARVAHFQRWRRHLDRGLLPEGDVDARVGGIDPATQEQKTARSPRSVAQVQHQIVRLDHSLIPGGREIRDVHVVVLAQSREHIVATLVGGGEGQAALRNVEQSKLHRTRRNESLIDENVDGIRMVDGYQLHLVGVRRLP